MNANQTPPPEQPEQASNASRTRTPNRLPWRVLRIAQYALTTIVALWGLWLIGSTVLETLQGGNFSVLLLQVLLLATYLLFFIGFQLAFVYLILSRTRIVWLLPHQMPYRFADYAGNPEALAAVARMVALLRSIRVVATPESAALGGLLINGPAGTGKRHLARILAAEARVPYGYISATSLKTSRFGLGPLKVTMAYRRARKLAREYGACVLLLDELEAIAHRDQTSQDNTGVYQELLLQINPPVAHPGWWVRWLRWATLRGSQQQQGRVLTVGITNDASTLDPALFTPERFGRQITLGLPNAAERRAFLEYALTRLPYETLPLDRLVQVTAGYSPALIKQVLDEALLYSRAAGRSAVQEADIWRALESRPLPSAIRSDPADSADSADEPEAEPLLTETERRRIAYHKAGYAFAQATLRPGGHPDTVLVRLHEQENPDALVDALELLLLPGSTYQGALTREELLTELQMLLAGQAATEELLGVQTTAAIEDLRQATRIATLLVGAFGMGQTLFSYLTLPADAWERALYSGTLREQVETLLREQAAEVRGVIARHHATVTLLADALLLCDELTRGDVQRLLESETTPVQAAALGSDETPALPVAATVSEELLQPARVLVARRVSPTAFLRNGGSAPNPAEPLYPVYQSPVPAEDEPEAPAEPLHNAPAEPSEPNEPSEPSEPNDASRNPATKPIWSDLYESWGPPPPEAGDDPDRPDEPRRPRS